MQSNLDPLPVRGSDTVEILISDHQQIKRLLSALTESTAAPSRKQTLEQLKAALTIHNATEENLVYPALSEVAHKKGEARKLYHETAEADILVFELDTMLKEGKDGNFTTTAEKLQKAVLEHIDDEESSAFPHLQKGADPMHAQLLTTSVREFRSALQFNSAATPGRSEMGEIGSAARTPT